ncbi:Uncharacterised protein [Moraxella lacunata]|uniref:Uncharacterized protein n=1 Tax=Moraxella lacunata TaxID=477 RepID=A0A378QD15_MORLA|nr:Uncharacterised protein [Moraxella lacunata]
MLQIIIRIFLLYLPAILFWLAVIAGLFGYEL